MFNLTPQSKVILNVKARSAITESPGCNRSIIQLQHTNSLSEIDPAYNLDTIVMIPDGEIPFNTL